MDQDPLETASEKETELTPEEIQERAETRQKTRRLFEHPCTFVTSVYDLKTLPPQDWPEIAFAGRSNVGKSSLINAVFKKKGLAKASNTPGRTQCLNFFQMDTHLHVVDMPGYGYAKAPKDLVDSWNKMLRLYLKGRVQLKRVFLLIDSRHGLKANDIEIMDMLDEAAVSYQVILTKIDKIKPPAVQKRVQEVQDTAPKHPALYPEILVSSSEKNAGLDEIRYAVGRVLL